MKVFWITFLIGVFIVAGVNMYVDPAGRWHDTTKVADFKANWQADEAWITPDVLIERYYVMGHLNVAPTPDILFLGSSRAMLVDSDMFAPDISIHNASISGAYAQDLVSVWQHVKNLKKIPKEVILFLDPWVFNKSEPSFWDTNLNLYEQFVQEHGGTFSTAGIKQRLKYVRHRLNDVTDLITWQITKRSAKIIHKGRREPRVVKLNELDPRFQAKRFDGAMIYPQAEVKEPSLEDITQRSMQFSANCIYSLCDWRLDGRAVQELKWLVEDIEAQNAKLMIVFAPYQQITYNVLMTSPKYSEIIPTITEIVNDMNRSSKGDGFAFCNKIDPEVAQCEPTEFMDGMHSLRSCTEKIVKGCLKEDGWTGQISSVP